MSPSIRWRWDASHQRWDVSHPGSARRAGERAAKMPKSKREGSLPGGRTRSAGAASRNAPALGAGPSGSSPRWAASHGDASPHGSPLEAKHPDFIPEMGAFPPRWRLSHCASSPARALPRGLGETPRRAAAWDAAHWPVLPHLVADLPNAGWAPPPTAWVGGVPPKVGPFPETFLHSRQKWPKMRNFDPQF